MTPTPPAFTCWLREARPIVPLCKWGHQEHDSHGSINQEQLVKRIAISAAAIAVAALGFTSSASAQLPSVVKPVRLGVSLGAAMPTGDFGKAVNTGYNATGSLALQPAGLPIGLRIDAAFNQFGVKSDVGGGNANIFAVTGNALVNVIPGPALGAYVIGGAGYYHESLSGTVLNGSPENHFGFNIGGGLNIPLTGFDAFIEARYHRVSEKDGSTSFVPITVGVMF